MAYPYPSPLEAFLDVISDALTNSKIKRNFPSKIRKGNLVLVIEESRKEIKEKQFIVTICLPFTIVPCIIFKLEMSAWT